MKYVIAMLLLTSPLAALEDIFVVGDSIVAGLPMGFEKSWVYLLQEEMKDQITIHRSSLQHSSQTEAALEVLPEVLAIHPKYFIICLGINDIGRGFSKEYTLNNLRTAIISCENNGIKVILGFNDLSGVINQEPWKSFVSTYWQLFNEFKNIIPFEYITPKISLNPSLHIGDKFHPNELGHLILKERMKLILMQELSCSNR